MDALDGVRRQQTRQGSGLRAPALVQRALGVRSVPLRPLAGAGVPRPAPPDAPPRARRSPPRPRPAPRRPRRRRAAASRGTRARRAPRPARTSHRARRAGQSDLDVRPWWAEPRAVRRGRQCGGQGWSPATTRDGSSDPGRCGAGPTARPTVRRPAATGRARPGPGLVAGRPPRAQPMTSGTDVVAAGEQLLVVHGRPVVGAATPRAVGLLLPAVDVVVEPEVEGVVEPGPGSPGR